MDIARAVRLGSYALAAWVLLPVAFAVGVADFVPFLDPIAQLLGNVIPFEMIPLSLALFAAFPLVVLARAATGSPADIVLAVFAVPCLLALMWTLSTHFVTTSGVNWGSFLYLITATLLALVVVGDAVLTYTITDPT